MTTAQLARYYGDYNLTLGYLTTPGGWGCYTLERPYMNNMRNVSCIPEGNYALAARPSPLIAKITRGRYTAGYEVTGVMGRDFIMIHPGNFPTDTEGCILVGRAPKFIAGRLGVSDSFTTYSRLMVELANTDRINISQQGVNHEVRSVILNAINAFPARYVRGERPDGRDKLGAPDSTS